MAKKRTASRASKKGSTPKTKSIKAPAAKKTKSTAKAAPKPTPKAAVNKRAERVAARKDKAPPQPKATRPKKENKEPYCPKGYTPAEYAKFQSEKKRLSEMGNKELK